MKIGIDAKVNEKLESLLVVASKEIAGEAAILQW